MISSTCRQRDNHCGLHQSLVSSSAVRDSPTEGCFPSKLQTLSALLQTMQEGRVGGCNRQGHHAVLAFRCGRAAAISASPSAQRGAAECIAAAGRHSAPITTAARDRGGLTLLPPAPSSIAAAAVSARPGDASRDLQRAEPGVGPDKERNSSLPWVRPVHAAGCIHKCISLTAAFLMSCLQWGGQAAGASSNNAPCWQQSSSHACQSLLPGRGGQSPLAAASAGGGSCLPAPPGPPASGNCSCAAPAHEAPALSTPRRSAQRQAHPCLQQPALPPQQHPQGRLPHLQP